VATSLFLTVVYLVVAREVRAGETVNTGMEVYRTVVTPGVIAGGQFGRYLVFAHRFVGPVVISGGLAYGLATGSAAVVMAAVLAGVSLITTAVATTMSAIALFDLSAHRIPFLRRHARLIGGVVLFGFGSVLAGSRTSLGVPVEIPIGWFGRAVLDPSLGLLAGAVSIASLTTIIAVGVTSLRIARVPPRHETVEADDGVTKAAADGEMARNSTEKTVIVRLLTTFVSRPVAGIAVTTWRRIRRRPSAALYAVVMGPFSAVAVVLSLNQFEIAPVIATAVYTAPLAGVVAASNPLGSEGTSLPATLTTSQGPSALAWGYVLAAGLPGVGMVVSITAVVGLFTTPATTVLAVGLAGVLAFTAVSVAVGVGTRYPQYDGVDLVSSQGIKSPRPETLGVLFAAIPLLGVPAVTMGGLATVSLTGVAVSITASAVVAWLSLRTAIETIGGIEL
jgi:hypothetical protein